MSSSTPGPTLPGAGLFLPAVNQAMAAIQNRTQLPLAAPRNIPISGSEGHLYLAAQTTALAAAYHVHLQLTVTPLSVNNPTINTPQNSGLANDFGGFGATQYQTPSQAEAVLEHALYAPKAGSPVNSISLGGGVVGQVYQDPGIIQWTDGQWTLQVVGEPSIDESEAKKIVQCLAGQKLPATRGVMVVLAAGDGDHTVVGFQVGDVLYRVSDYHSAIGAIEMTMGLKGWPTSQNLYF
ncbi:hypothetical protein [Sulfobacillus harzensis]|uniref:Uncharacterized protein n=1 Tax=Sulfobacillus harzensis TaxID=2729629 RepID=A0A7Y0Q2U8_9FIRM|nr:hypothetical protein [Sulfobacillus harzensis]NMP22922.1 hypothetical protein [Sulfobacillus harzensis]